MKHVDAVQLTKEDEHYVCNVVYANVSVLEFDFLREFLWANLS